MTGYSLGEQLTNAHGRIDLDAIEARAAAATEGPWRLSEPQGNWIWPHIANTYGSRREDAEFIAHAREDVPALVETLRAARDYVESVWGRAEQAAEQVRRIPAAGVAQAFADLADILGSDE